MHPPSYYREQADLARRLARGASNAEISETLSRLALDYDDMALEAAGLIEVPYLPPGSPIQVVLEMIG
jgi:hypothetical protein